jgi:hypothetical protein
VHNEDELKDKNPFDICIWKDISECESCSIEGRLQCHENFHYSLWFMVGFLPGFVFSILGIILGFIFGNLNLNLFITALVIWISYFVLFFILWEPRMLCRHCPYYAEGDAKVVHCYANHGLPKTTSFNPAPMTKFEKIQFIIGIALFIGIPIPFILFGGQFIFAIIAIIGAIFWLLILRFKICPDCVNFSCPFNRVPKNVVDCFLKRNSIMKEAWEKSGYKID